MRLRSAGRASLLAALVAVATPAAVLAAPRHNHQLTIAAVPHHILAGEEVLIYGQLQGADVAGQTIRLFHRIAGAAGYSQVSTTLTDAHGYYEFLRADGVVTTDRSWFVRGPDASHSRTVYEQVAALVSLAASNTDPSTGQHVLLTGTVTPAHPYERILIQQRRSGDDWSTLGPTVTDAGSHFAYALRWRAPGVYELRAVFPGDARNVWSPSDPITMTVQQAQIPGLSIASSNPVITYGQATTLSGLVDEPGTTTAQAGVPVTLLAWTVDSRRWVAVAAGQTGSDGRYSFTQSPPVNTRYEVRLTSTPARHSAVLFEGVRDVVSAAATPGSAPFGSTIAFTGSVLPGNPGGVVYLQRLGEDGDWHTVAASTLNRVSAYSIAWTVGDVGTDVFRVRALADRDNLGGASAPATVTVTPSGPGQLPPGS